MNPKSHRSAASRIVSSIIVPVRREAICCFRRCDTLVVYPSDHGEEVFDYAHRNGRLHDPTRSVVDERFDPSRARLLREEKIDYDRIVRRP